VRSFIPRSVGPWLAVLTLTAAGTAAAVGYGLTAPKKYRATAQLLVSPVSVSDPTFDGLDVLRDSGGRQTAAASAAALLRSPQVADEVRADLGLARSRDSLLNALDAHVVDSSDVVAVTVEDTSAAGAAQLANAFADGLVKQRTASFQSQLTSTIRRDQQLLAAIPPAKRASGAGVELEKRIAVLQGFQGQPDPTIRHAGQASAPVSASWPKLPKLAATGAVAGLLVGLLVALVLVLGRVRRRVGAGDGAPYDHAVSDRLVERLEQRLSERIAALEEEHQRLAKREAGLAVRERDVAAKLDELRAAMATVPSAGGPSSAGPPDEAAVAALDLRAAALDGRVAELTQREIALARRAAELAKREQELAARTEELARDAAEPADDAAAEALDERTAALDARIAELTQREVGLARRAAEVGKQEQQATARAEELDVRAAELEEKVHEAEQAALAAPEPEPVAPPAAVVAQPAFAPPDGSFDEDATGAWNLLVLERLVNDRGEEFPDKRDEWISYLYLLREYAEPDGTVPSSFDWLIQDTFAELVP
jgi:capsular polysaccharide biosynthesis protein